MQRMRSRRLNRSRCLSVLRLSNANELYPKCSHLPGYRQPYFAGVLRRVVAAHCSDDAMRGLISLAVLIAFVLAWVLTISKLQKWIDRDVPHGVAMALGIAYFVAWALVVQHWGLP